MSSPVTRLCGCGKVIVSVSRSTTTSSKPAPSWTVTWLPAGTITPYCRPLASPPTGCGPRASYVTTSPVCRPCGTANVMLFPTGPSLGSTPPAPGLPGSIGPPLKVPSPPPGALLCAAPISMRPPASSRAPPATVVVTVPSLVAFEEKERRVSTPFCPLLAEESASVVPSAFALMSPATITTEPSTPSLVSTTGLAFALAVAPASTFTAPADELSNVAAAVAMPRASSVTDCAPGAVVPPLTTLTFPSSSAWTWLLLEAVGSPALTVTTPKLGPSTLAVALLVPVARTTTAAAGVAIPASGPTLAVTESAACASGEELTTPTMPTATTPAAALALLVPVASTVSAEAPVTWPSKAAMVRPDTVAAGLRTPTTIRPKLRPWEKAVASLCDVARIWTAPVMPMTPLAPTRASATAPEVTSARAPALPSRSMLTAPILVTSIFASAWLCWSAASVTEPAWVTRPSTSARVAPLTVAVDPISETARMAPENSSAFARAVFPQVCGSAGFPQVCGSAESSVTCGPAVTVTAPGMAITAFEPTSASVAAAAVTTATACAPLPPTTERLPTVAVALAKLSASEVTVSAAAWITWPSARARVAAPISAVGSVDSIAMTPPERSGVAASALLTASERTVTIPVVSTVEPAARAACVVRVTVASAFVPAWATKPTLRLNEPAVAPCVPVAVISRLLAVTVTAPETNAVVTPATVASGCIADSAIAVPNEPPLALASVDRCELASTWTGPPVAVSVAALADAWVVPSTVAEAFAPAVEPPNTEAASEMATELVVTAWSASASIRMPADPAVTADPATDAETVLSTVLSASDTPVAKLGSKLPLNVNATTVASIPELSRACTRTRPKAARTTAPLRMNASTVRPVSLLDSAPAAPMLNEMVEAERLAAMAMAFALICDSEVASMDSEPPVDSTDAASTPARTT